MLPPPAPTDPAWALVVATIYFGSFITIGIAAKIALGWLTRRMGADLREVHGQAGSNRRSRKVFLLGAWRTERDD